MVITVTVNNQKKGADIGLEVGSGGAVTMTGSGTFDVKSTNYAVYVHDGGTATVSSAESYNKTGVFATSGGSAIITGKVCGDANAIETDGAGSFVHAGSAVASSIISFCVAAENASKVIVDGDVISVFRGCTARGGSSITVGGSVNASWSEGVLCRGTGSTVHVLGNVSAVSRGVYASSGGVITVDGSISVSNMSGTYALVNCIEFDGGKDDRTNPTAKAGYYTYTDSTSTVYVKIPSSIVSVTGITVSGAGGARSINTDGGTLQMIADVSPYNVDNGSVTWSVVSGGSYGSISSNGMLTATGNGMVKVQATSNDSSAVYGTVEITISGQTA